MHGIIHYAFCDAEGCTERIECSDSMLLPHLLFLGEWTRDAQGWDFCKAHRPADAREIEELRVRGDG
jgi:hypothetical protein